MQCATGRVIVDRDRGSQKLKGLGQVKIDLGALTI